MTECSVDDCEALVRTRAMCRNHYRRLMDHGHPLGKLYAVHGDRITRMRRLVTDLLPGRPTLPVQFSSGTKKEEVDERDLDRFLSKVEVQADGAWLWQGALNDSNYGEFHLGAKNGPMALAHRVAYTALVGPIPEGLHLDHVLHNEAVARGECPGGNSCLHRRNVNPLHLVPRTRQENWLLGAGSFVGPQLTNLCKYGHPLTGDNVRLERRKNGNVARICRACCRRRYHESVARKRNSAA